MISPRTAGSVLALVLLTACAAPRPHSPEVPAHPEQDAAVSATAPAAASQDVPGSSRSAQLPGDTAQDQNAPETQQPSTGSFPSEMQAAPVPAIETKERGSTAVPAARTPSASGAAPIRRETIDRSGGDLIAPGEILTVATCIEIAHKNNPAIVAATGTVDVYRNRVGEARSVYYPHVSAVGLYNRSRVATETSTIVTGDPANPFPMRTPAVEDVTPSHVYSGSVVLNQNIYDFGRTSSSVNISKYDLESSRSDLDFTRDAVILSVKQAYYGVLQAQRGRDVATDVLKQFQMHLDQAKGFFDVGTKSKIDVTKAEVDLSNAKLSLINAENSLKLARVTLNNVMGVPDAPEYSIEDNLSFQKYAVTLEEATAKAFENRPDLKSVVAKRQAAEANVSLQRSDYYPSLSGSAGVTTSKYELDEEPDTNTSTNSWNAGVTLTVPLFEGLVTRHRVAEAKSGLAVRRANEEATRQQVLFDVRQAYLNLQAAEASIATAELAAQQAKENLDLANGRYAAGVGSPIEVSDAFTTYVTAQASYTNALYNYKIAQASIEKAMGDH